MKALLVIVVGGLLLFGVALALVAFPWSPLRDLVSNDSSVIESPAGGGAPPPEGGEGEGAPTPSPEGGGQDGEYTGTGSRNLGTIEVPEDSTLSWTNEGESGNLSFAVMDTDFRINVSVQGEPSGQSPVEAGTYQEVTVNAVGPWTMTIEPR